MCPLQRLHRGGPDQEGRGRLDQRSKPRHSGESVLQDLVDPITNELQFLQLLCSLSTQTHGSPAQRSTEDAVRSADPEGSHQRAAGRAKPVSTLIGAGRKPGMAGPNRASRGAKKVYKPLMTLIY